MFKVTIKIIRRLREKGISSCLWQNKQYLLQPNVNLYKWIRKTLHLYLVNIAFCSRIPEKVALLRTFILQPFWLVSNCISLSFLLRSGSIWSITIIFVLNKVSDFFTNLYPQTCFMKVKTALSELRNWRICFCVCWKTSKTFHHLIGKIFYKIPLLKTGSCGLTYKYSKKTNS